MPNTLLEAMAVGIPCISTNCPTGPSDIIKDKENGFLVEVNNVNQLANRILDIINNPSIRKSFSFYGKKTISEKFLPKKVTNKLIEICENN